MCAEKERDIKSVCGERERERERERKKEKERDCVCREREREWWGVTEERRERKRKREGAVCAEREGAKESGGESLSRRNGAGREWAKGAEGL